MTNDQSEGILRIIPAIDLMDGQVVCGQAGQRKEYRPVASQLIAGSEPGPIASALLQQVEQLQGAGEFVCYIADLDSIAGKPINLAAWQAIAAAAFTLSRSVALWVDAGTGHLASAQHVAMHLEELSPHWSVVVGSESLAHQSDLLPLVTTLSPERVVFSLDLVEGKPLTRCRSLRNTSPLEIARQVADLGIGRLIVLDLSGVGSRAGNATRELCHQIHLAFPQLELIAGGGVRHQEDLDRLGAVGCQGALLATAFHEGSFA